MKICIVNNLYGRFRKGGAERVVELTAEKLAAEGHEIDIITTKPPAVAIGGDNQPDKYRIIYLPSLYFNLDKIPKVARLFWHVLDMFDFITAFKVMAILRKKKYDAVVTHNLKGISYLLPLVIKISRVKHLHVLHDIQLLHPSGLMIYGQEKNIETATAKIYTLFTRVLFASPNAVIAPSNWLLRLHEGKSFFKNSIKTVLLNPPNIISAFTPHIISDKRQNNIFCFLYVGQLELHKGILLLVNAFIKFREKFPQFKCRLIIVGTGTIEEKLKIVAAGEKSIEFMGHKSGQEIEEIMHKSDSLVVPSVCYENSPTVIYEALSAGLPVLASRIGGIPELFSPGYDYFFTPADEEGLIAKMKMIIERKETAKKQAEERRDCFAANNLDNYVYNLLNFIK